MNLQNMGGGKMNFNEIDNMIQEHYFGARGNRMYRPYSETLDFLLKQKGIRMRNRITQVDHVKQLQDIGPVVEVNFCDQFPGETQGDFTLFGNAEFTPISTLDIPNGTVYYEVYLTRNGRSIKNVEYKQLDISRQLAHSQGKPNIDTGDGHLYYHLIFRTTKSFLNRIDAYATPKRDVVYTETPRLLQAAGKAT